MAETLSQVTTETLESFADAWNCHDVDAIMEYFTHDCIFITGWGARFERKSAVREGVSEFCERFPDGRFSNANHFVTGNRGVSEWIFTATGPEGEKLEMRGCDVFVFRDGKILEKNAFRKEYFR